MRGLLDQRINSADIQAMFIDGTRLYLAHLDANRFGLHEIGVFEITELGNHCVVFKLSAKIQDLDAILFRIKGDNYDTQQIKIVEYDVDENLLTVRPADTVIGRMVDLKPGHVQIVSDLKFLVRRVLDWYQKKGGQILFDRDAPALEFKENYLPNKRPSPNQVEAIRTIYASAFSYVWGAPGTGKTQFVMAYCILNYLLNGKKVAVLAPTNNAIEQVLRGVISMTDAAKVERKQIVRLGAPTRKFAIEYPEVCEERGVLKRVNEIEKQLKILDKIVACRQKAKSITAGERIGQLFDQMDTALEKRQTHIDDLGTHRRKHAVVLGQFKIMQVETRQLQMEIEKIYKQINSFWCRIIKAVSKGKTEKETLLVHQRQQFERLNQTLSKMHDELRQIEGQIKTCQTKADETTEIDQIVVNIQCACRLTSLADVVCDLSLRNCGERRKRVEAVLAREKAEVEDELATYAEYEHITDEDLDNKRVHLCREVDRLRTRTTGERLKSASVIAATLDGYIFRFIDEDLAVDHVFVDEAGYANLAKGLVVFSMKAPVTFLGDHFQLPPVCEDRGLDYDLPDNQNVFIWGQSAIYAEDVFVREASDVFSDFKKGSAPRFRQMRRTDLVETHRFGSRLAEVLDSQIYKNGFRSAVGCGTTVIKYINVVQQAFGDNKRENKSEVNAIRSFVENRRTLLNDFVILAPYSNQVKSLGYALPLDRNEHRILTVHGAQGREWDTVILSVVDCAPDWFTDSRNQRSKGRNLINTAVSRAKKTIVVVCDVANWKTYDGQLIKALLDVAEEVQPW